MATYKGIKGFRLQNFSQDPVPTTVGWAAGGNLSQARFSLAGAGTQTAGLAFGGRTPSVVASTEEWNAPASNTVTFTAS